MCYTDTTKQNVKLTLLGLCIALAMVLTGKHSHAQESASITVAGGCFWCVEKDFESVDGVSEAISGYTGGSVENPTYRQVVSGGTGHYEAVRIEYDPGTVTRRDLFDLFFRSVDPTDAGGQFCDRGMSYATAIFVGDATERAEAEAAKAAAQAALGQTIVTPILDAGAFYEAEEYHQDYYKSETLVLTRFGPRSKAEAYKRYRKGCGRDARVKELWGDDAPFAGS